MLYEGERIKIFPDTDIRTYKNWISSQGFSYFVHGEYIVIGRKGKCFTYDATALGKLISSHRKAKGMDRFELADRIGVIEDSVFEWEIGRKQPKENNLLKLREVLDITKEELEKCLI